MLKLYYANIAPLRDEAYCSQAMELLYAERRERLLQIKSKEERCRGTAAALLLRMALTEEKIPYEGKAFSYGIHGKPEILNQNIHFNISHAGNYAVCAVCNQEVGVDLERLTRLDGRTEQIDRIARRILTEKESRLWEKSGENASMLLQIWTRKESYAKMLGVGLSMELKDLDTTDGAFYQQMQPDNEHFVSVCTRELCEPMRMYDRTNDL